MSDRVRTGLLSLLLSAVLVVAAGCGGSSFVGHHFDNFTAYYNTFYNARTAFDEGVKAVEGSDEAVDRRYYIDVFSTPARASGSDRFQNAIDKSADVLRDHPGSKWVDDALLLIGKSYFYSQNFVGAEQKFREVVELGSPLEDEARLWLARTLIAAGAYGEARDHLVASLNEEDLSGRWKPRIHLALGELYVKQESFEDAAEQLELGLEEVRDNDLEARGWLLLGQVLETLEQYEDAVEAYEQVGRAHPRYELSYAANVSAVRVRGLHLDAEQALRDLRRMQRDDKNFSNRFELAYLQGLIYQADDRAGDAREKYHEVLYDSEGQIGDLRGRIHYALGELYSNVHEDYLLASAHYDTAKTSLATGAQQDRVERQYAPEAITNADRKAEVFSTFAEVRRNVARMDSLLELGSLPDEEFTERIMEIRRARAEELSEQQRLVEQRQAERGFQDAAARSAAGDSRSAANEATGAAGFLFHRDPVRVQESRMSFITRWGDRPHVPNWRRSNAVAAASSDREIADRATAARVRDNSAGVDQNPLPQIDYSDVPRDSLSQAKMQALRALARYELGNVLFLAMERPDSAAAWYRMVIEEDPGENVAQRAYYALAEVQRSLGDTAAANTIYEKVLRDYPKSDFAGRVREQLGIPSDVPTDSISIAFSEYQQAFSNWRRGYHRRALNEMISVAANHSRTEAAPKALMAAGRIYMEWADADSLDIFAPLPLDVDEAVLKEAGLNVASMDPAESGAPRNGKASTGTGNSAGSANSPPTSSTVAREEQKVSERLAAERGSASPRQRIEDPALADVDNDDVLPLKAREDTLAVTTPREDTLAVTTPREDTLAVTATRDDTLAVTAPRDDTLTVTAPRDDALTVKETPIDSATAADSLIIAVGLVPDLGDVDEESEAEEGGVYLETLYASIKSGYPSTVYAAQADEMLQALESHRQDVLAAADTLVADSVSLADTLRAQSGTIPADTTSAAPADTTFAAADTTSAASADTTFAAADTTAAASADTSSAAARSTSATASDTTAATASDDTTAATASADSTSIVAETSSSSAGADTSRAIPSGEQSLRSRDGIDKELGGFTIVLGMNVNEAPMEALAQKYAEKGFRAGVIQETVGNTTLYRAAIGHFASVDVARSALLQLSDELEKGAQVAPLELRR